MDDEYGDEQDLDQEESGSSLRQKLESTLAANRELTTQLAALTASQVISENKLDLVTPEDLTGVKLEDIPARAKALQEEKLEIAKTVLSKTLGVDDPDQLKGLLEGGAESTATAEALQRVRGIGSGGDAPRTSPADQPGLLAEARLRAAFAAQKS